MLEDVAAFASSSSMWPIVQGPSQAALEPHLIVNCVAMRKGPWKLTEELLGVLCSCRLCLTSQQHLARMKNHLQKSSYTLEVQRESRNYCPQSFPN